MAFDDPTRNRLSKFVSDTRKLLSKEFAQQMREVYGLDPTTGVVTDIDKLPSMAEGDRQTAQMLRDTLEHYLASSSKRDKKQIATTIDRIVREQAFTVLNRLCAVRMAEARDLVIESIALGTKSKGFQLYARLAGSALGETGEAYVCYLFSLFDELSIDLPVLFDRFSPSGRLFPKESVLLEVLDQINHHEIQHLWAEDETIGWVYQYFNSQEERRAMRDESSAPRNSRELAVRNQFFTPRYVVEFLTDNTLGRIWYEMTQGQTRIVNECKYLVRRQDEVFLSHMTCKDLEHPSNGSLAMAELLLSGTEETFLEFSARDHQPMIELAHCVSAYTTMGDRAHEILANHTLLVREGSMLEPREAVDAVEAAPYVFAGQLGTLRTQHILEVLFMTCRSDRHGGDGSVYSECWFVGACNEVRRRALNSRRDDLTQDELLRQPIFIPYRAMKDPRDIKMLDPACGSMHFGLYAFDLFLRIYEEFWDIEERIGQRNLDRPHGGKSIRDSYGSIESYMLDVPRLIIERNIYGIDIDARAVQIAGLSLWLRAQKVWHMDAIKPSARPHINQSNIVCAEPMPGEASLLEQFISEHLSQTSEQQTIASIVRRVFDEMKQAGELGSLLKIEEAIAETIAEAKKKWIDGPKALQLPLFDIDAQSKSNLPRPLLVQGVDDVAFWDEIEERIYSALRDYSVAATTDSGFQRRLFAKDAASGFAFIDVCRHRYDIALMNPPFGDSTINSRSYIDRTYSNSKSDIGMVFIACSNSRLVAKGKLGAITNRVFIANETLDVWRDTYLLGGKACLSSLLDLGYGVLDDAKVEAAAFVIDRQTASIQHATFLRVLDARNKELAAQSILSGERVGQGAFLFLRGLKSFGTLPGHVLAYQLPPSLVRRVTNGLTLSALGGKAVVGLQPSDDYRFVRLAWEVLPESIGRCQEWPYYAKGGEYQPYWDDIHLLVRWHNDGQEIRSFAFPDGKPRSYARNPSFYYLPGITYPERTTSDFSPRVLPQDCIFSGTGQGVFCGSRELDLAYIVGAHSRAFKLIVDAIYGSGDASSPSSMATHYRSAVLTRLPPPVWDRAQAVSKSALTLVMEARKVFRFDETSRYFIGAIQKVTSIAGQVDDEIQDSAKRFALMIQAHATVDRLVLEELGFDDADRAIVSSLVGQHPLDYRDTVSPGCEQSIEELWKLPESELIKAATERHGSRRQLTMKSYAANRRFELVAHTLEANAIDVASYVAAKSLSEPKLRFEVSARNVSWLAGVAFGRWDIRFNLDSRQMPDLPDPFSPLPKCPPGQLQDMNGLPAKLYSLPENYPVDIPWNGILVDDPNHSDDIVARVRYAMALVWSGKQGLPTPESVEYELCENLGVRELREYFRKPSLFFADHLSRYSKSRRQAPIYLPLSLPSSAYTIWLYYHRLTDQTLYSVINDYVEPKQRETQNDLKSLLAKVNRSKFENAEIERLESLLKELTVFRAELETVAKIWKPNQNDGVQITAAPLWQFFQQKKWRDSVKKVWEELEHGEYDWANMALSIWPERVVRTAHNDRSIAIAHSLESLLWHEVEIKKSSKAGRVTLKTEWRPRELSERELDEIAHRVKNAAS